MTTPDIDKVKSRLQKMLALGNCMGTTEGERDAAMSQAYKMMVKYNLTEADVKAHGEAVQEVRDGFTQAGWSMPWAKEATWVIADLFFCVYTFGSKINSTKCWHTFIGKESNAKSAMLVTDYIVGSILKEGRTRYGDNLCPETRSFAVGAVEKLYHRVKALKAEAAAEQAAGNYAGGTALVLADLYASEKTANELLLSPNVRTKTIKHKAVDGDAYYAGKKFAENLSLNVRVK